MWMRVWVGGVWVGVGVWVGGCVDVGVGVEGWRVGGLEGWRVGGLEG